MPLPKYWYTDFTKESAEYVNKTYNLNLQFVIGWKYIGYDGSPSQSLQGIDLYNDPRIFQNNPAYLTPEQFMEAIKTEEFKRGDIVIDEEDNECEFIADLGEKDDDGFRYITKLKGSYFMAESVKHKQQDTSIQDAIDLLTKAGKIKDGKVLV